MSMGMTTEELCIQNIARGIRLIQSGKKSPKEAGVGSSLNRLKEMNLGMYEDLLAKYKIAVERYNSLNK